MNNIVELSKMLLAAQEAKNTSEGGYIGKVLYNEVCLNHQGSKPLLQVPTNECRNVGMAYAVIALCYSWDTIDVNSVAAENAYYCLAKSIIKENDLYAAPPIFTILQKWPDLLKDKLIDSWCSLEEEEWQVSIGRLLGGNPFTGSTPQCEDFIKRAFSFKDYIMYHVLCKFYDIKNHSYNISKDVPCFIPSELSIDTFLSSIQNIKEKRGFEKEAERHFFSVFRECEKTLIMVNEQYERNADF